MLSWCGTFKKVVLSRWKTSWLRHQTLHVQVLIPGVLCGLVVERNVDWEWHSLFHLHGHGDLNRNRPVYWYHL